MAEILGWWFAQEARLPHRDNRPVVVGETLRVEPPLTLCQHGLHLSEHPADALKYACGSLLYRVHGSEEITRGDDKAVVSARKALAVRDAEAMLRADARASALSVINLWEAPNWVREYLENGDERIRDMIRAMPLDRAATKANIAAYATACAAHRARFLSTVIDLFGGADALAAIDGGRAR